MKPTLGTISIGAVLRLDLEKFPDMIIRKIDKEGIHLERPYAFVSSSQTSCPTVLVGIERLTIEASDSALARFTQVSQPSFPMTV